MIDMLTIGQTVRTSWLKARSHASDAALRSMGHPYLALALLYGVLAYLGSAVLIGVPGRAIMALIVVGPAACWCFGRYKALASAQSSTLSFFTGENGPLRLSEDILTSKVVYCIGLRNEGAKAVGNVRVTIDGVEGHPYPTVAASLPIFRMPADNADLQPGESEYFCVMRRTEGPKEDEGSVVICSHNDLIAPSFALRELVDGKAITLSVCSDGTPQMTKRIEISSKREAGAPWSLDLKLLADTDETPTQIVEQTPIARPSIPDTGMPPTQVIEQNPVAHPPMPDAGTTPTQAVEQSPVAQPPIQEPSAHSERVRRLLARQAKA